MKSLRLCYLAMLTCLGLVLPTVFHLAAGPAAGAMFLPLHIPVLIAGLILGSTDGFFMGLFLPLLSALITGMPPPAILPFKCVELSLYGFFCGAFFKITKRYGVSLILSLISANIIYISFFSLLFYAFGVNVPTLAVVLSNLVTGLPGITLQLIFIPQICFAITKLIRTGIYGL